MAAARLLHYGARDDPAKTTDSKIAFFSRDCCAGRRGRTAKFHAHRWYAASPCLHVHASLLDNDICADPAKIAGSRFDFSSRTYASVLFPSSPARITSSRACASAARVCTAHARRARVCIAFEGNIVLGTVAHGHPRGARHPSCVLKRDDE